MNYSIFMRKFGSPAKGMCIAEAAWLSDARFIANGLAGRADAGVIVEVWDKMTNEKLISWASSCTPVAIKLFDKV